jgi:hypothetical protein
LGVRRHVRAAEARSPAQFDGFESLDSRLARLRKPHSGSFAFLLSTPRQRAVLQHSRPLADAAQTPKPLIPWAFSPRQPL